MILDDFGVWAWFRDPCQLWKLTLLGDVGGATGDCISYHIPGLVMTNIELLKMAIEIVDLPIEKGDFPELC